MKGLSGISINTSELSVKLKTWLNSVFQTMEGKIIGAALGFALLMMTFSGLFFDDSSQDVPVGDPQNNELMQGGVSLNPGDETMQPTNSVDGETDEEAGQKDYDYLALPEPIVLPQQREDQSNNRSGREEINETVSEEPAEQSDRNEDSTETENTLQPPPSNSSEPTPSETRSTRRIEVAVTGQFVEGIFNETVSTATHKTGQQFYLVSAGSVYANGYKIIESGARIRAVVSDVKTRGNSRRAFLAVTFEAVQAVDGSWLPISYPEYSNQSTGNVVFEKGRTIRRLRLESGRVFITTN